MTPATASRTRHEARPLRWANLLPSAQVALAAGLMLAVLLASPATAAVLMRPLPERTLPSASIASVDGWMPVERPLADWRPQLQAPVREERFAFGKGGRQVGVFVGIFRDQRQGAELVSSANQLAERTRSHGDGWQQATAKLQ